jgi:hypothetical protein
MAKAQPAKPAEPAQPQEPVAAEQAAGQEGGGGMMIDLSGVGEEQALPVIPRGVYNASVHDLTFGYSQSSNNPMWTVVFELDESAGDYAGRKVYYHMPFVENMMPRVKKVISRLAPELLEQAFNPESVADEGLLIGKTCQVRLDIRPYEGRKTNNVREVLAPAESAQQFLG